MDTMDLFTEEWEWEQWEQWRKQSLVDSQEENIEKESNQQSNDEAIELPW